MVEKNEEIAFKNAEEEYLYHLIRAETHIRQAMRQASNAKGPARSVVCKALLRRAHGIITGLYIQEAQNRKKR